MRLPNFSFLGSIIKIKYPKVADSLKYSLSQFLNLSIHLDSYFVAISDWSLSHTFHIHVFICICTILLYIIILCPSLVKFTHSLWFVFYISAFFVMYFLSFASLNSPIFVNILYTLKCCLFFHFFFLPWLLLYFILWSFFAWSANELQMVLEQYISCIYFMYKYFCKFVFVLCIVSINFIIYYYYYYYFLRDTIEYIVNLFTIKGFRWLLICMHEMSTH